MKMNMKREKFALIVMSDLFSVSAQNAANHNSTRIMLIQVPSKSTHKLVCLSGFLCVCECVCVVMMHVTTMISAPGFGPIVHLCEKNTCVVNLTSLYVGGDGQRAQGRVKTASQWDVTKIK